VASPAPLWLLDEPLNGLDARSVAAFLALVAAHRERGGQVVLASHDPEVVPHPVPCCLDDFAGGEERYRDPDDDDDIDPDDGGKSGWGRRRRSEGTDDRGAGE